MKQSQPKNIFEKIWDAHVVKQTQGHPAIFAVDLMLIHEVTSAQAFETLEKKGLAVFDTSKLLATIDHSIPTSINRWKIQDQAAAKQVNTLRQNCKKHGIPLRDFDQGQGIVHVIGPELGLTQPGMTIVCGDSHTSTHGAFGALAFGIGTSEVAHVMATGCLLQSKPKSMKIEFKGSFSKGVFAKDAILALISKIGIGGANGHVIEYCGDIISKMSMEERMTICNMSIECGARAGLISPDEITFAYLKERPYAPEQAIWSEAIAYWQSFKSDASAHYDRHLIVDLDALHPVVTWGTNPGHAVQITDNVPDIDHAPVNEQVSLKAALSYTKLNPGKPIAGTPIDWAFIGSCTNGRIEDLRIVAQVLKNNRINPNVTMYIVPGSEAVLEQAKKEQLDKIFAQAGAQLRLPGCSMCLAMNDDKVPPGKRCVSSSNRNFQGRQGPGSITHLASPATVAASAIAGYLTSPEQYF